MNERILFFRKNLLQWAASIQRPMPWKGIKDPYKIWLSEIILQQTRVEQGMPYYLRFIEQYPTVHQLAEAPEESVIKLWQGLGYYSRARNLHATAKIVSGELGGQFPENLDEIKKLKGIGDYTAAAIASFAFDLPHAVVDGNVIRVLARFQGLDGAADTSAGKKEFAREAQRFLDPDFPAQYNQAIMDFGALHCLPAKPLCSSCPMQEECRAKQENRVDELPAKKAKIKKRERFFIYLVIRTPEETFWIQQRTGNDIWNKLYEFPLLEFAERTSLPLDKPEMVAELFFGTPELPLRFIGSSKTYKHILSHQTIHAVFMEFQVEKSNFGKIKQASALENSLLVDQLSFKKMYPIPRLIARYWEEKTVSLRLI
ncbi:MAG: A/G-specific adenine glycosylase [Saprospiraceae bacterium]